MIQLLFFGRLGELAEQAPKQLPYDEQTATPAALVQGPLAVYPGLVEALAESQVMVAVNQSVVDWHSPLKDGDEVAFLPPVTGG